MDNKFIMLNLDDERSNEVAKILGNKTCKKIIDHLSENKEASEKDIADALKIPLNTAEYNLKKLVDSQIVEKTKNFFWSAKGKKIPMYKLSNKSIIISPHKKFPSELKSILPVAIISGLTAVALRQYFLVKQIAIQKSEAVFSSADKNMAMVETMRTGAETILTTQTPVWAWFLAGALFALLIFSVFKLIEMKGGKR